MPRRLLRHCSAAGRVIESVAVMLERLNKAAPLITAIATAVLAVLTCLYVSSNNRYVSLTHQLVLLQQTPEVDLALSPPLVAHDLIIHNSGPEAVIEAKVWWTAYLRDAKGATIGTLFYRQPSAASPQSWWEIPRLGVGQQESKNLGDLINNVGQNMDATKWGLQNLGVQSARLVLMLQYRRVVDHRLYRAYESGLLIKDSQTGKYFLQASPFTPEPAPERPTQ